MEEAESSLPERLKSSHWPRSQLKPVRPRAMLPRMEGWALILLHGLMGNRLPNTKASPLHDHF